MIRDILNDFQNVLELKVGVKYISEIRSFLQFDSEKLMLIFLFQSVLSESLLGDLRAATFATLQLNRDIHAF